MTIVYSLSTTADFLIIQYLFNKISRFLNNLLYAV